MQLPSPSPILKLNPEDVNLLVPELSITCCSLFEDLVNEETTKDVDCKSSLISTNNAQINIIDDFMVTSTPHEEIDAIYADDASEELSVKSFRTDIVNCLVETQRTELNKTYSKTDLKELVEYSLVKNISLGKEMVRARDKVKCMGYENQLSKKESIDLTKSCKNNKKPRSGNKVSETLCPINPIKCKLSGVNSVDCKGINMVYHSIFSPLTNKQKYNVADLESSLFKIKTKECGSNCKLYIVTFTEQVLFSFFKSCFLFLEVRIDFPYLFIGKNYNDILLHFSSTSLNCSCKKLTKAPQQISYFKENISKIKESCSYLEKEECRTFELLDNQNIKLDKGSNKSCQVTIKKNTLANTSTSYNLLDETTFSEYSSDQFWDYYGVEKLKEESSDKPPNCNEYLSVQCEEQGNGYLTYEMFVNELHNLTKQSNLSTDSLDTKSHGDNLSSASSGSSENNYINSESCFEYIKKVSSNVKSPSANKRPVVGRFDDLQYHYKCSVSSKCAINQTQYINVRCVLNIYQKCTSSGEPLFLN